MRSLFVAYDGHKTESNQERRSFDIFGAVQSYPATSGYLFIMFSIFIGLLILLD
jgi:hypothetical protein